MPAVTPWKDISTSEDFQSLTPEDQSQVKSHYFEKVIAPRIERVPAMKEAGRDAVYHEWMNRPDDSGQSKISSAASSFGRGAVSVVPNTVGGLGYLLNSEEMIGAGQDIDQSINSVLPINPVHADTFAIKAANAVGQAAGVMATGVGGMAALGEGMASKAILSTAGMAGAREGGQLADQYGMEGLNRAAMIGLGGALEVGTEMIPFGTAVELGVARQLFKVPADALQKASRKASTAIVSEGAEEWTAQTGQNLAVKALAPEGSNTPGVFQGSGEAGLLGIVGGTTFAGANTLAGKLAGPQPEAEAVAGIPATEPQLNYDNKGKLMDPLKPYQAQPINVDRDGVLYHRNAGGAWGLVPENPTPGEPIRFLDPLDGVESHLIDALDRQVEVASKPKPAVAQSEQPAVAEVDGNPHPPKPVEIQPSEVHLPDHLRAEAEQEARDGGMDWAHSVDLSQPVGVFHGPNGYTAFSDPAKVLAAQMTGRPLLIQPTVINQNEDNTTAEPPVPAGVNAPHVTQQLAEQLKSGTMVVNNDSGQHGTVEAVTPEHQVVVNHDDGSTSTVSPHDVSILPAESKSPAQGGIYTAVQIGGRVITTPGVHYNAVLDHITRNELKPMDKDGLDQQQTKELADKWAVKQGPEWLRNNVEEGFVIGGKFFNRVHAKQKLNDMGIPTPMAEKEKRDWLDSSDIANPASLQSPAEYQANQDENELALQSIGLPHQPGTRMLATSNIKMALIHISNDESLPDTVRVVAEMLAKMKMPDVVLSVVADARSNFAGLYTPIAGNMGEVTINTRHKGRGDLDARTSLVHEILHHVTTWKVHNPANEFERQQVENLNKLRLSAIRWAKLNADVASNSRPSVQFDYELSNVDEFIAGLFTRPDFQAFLATMPTELAPSLMGKVRSMLQDIFRAITQLISGGAVEAGSLLDESFGAALNLVHGKTAQSGLPPVSMNPAAIKLSKEDATEILHKINVLADTPDLQDDYEFTQEQADQLLAGVPRNGGEWNIPAFAIPAVIGELVNLAEITRGIAKDARGAEPAQAARMNKQAKRFEDEIIPAIRALAPPTLMSLAKDYRFSALEREQEFTPRNPDGSLQKLKDQWKYVNAIESNRTVDGKEIKDPLAYVPRRDEAMQQAVMDVIDDLQSSNASAEDVLKIITSGIQPGSNVHLESYERSTFARWLLRSGRYREFDGLSEDNIISAFESLASQSGSGLRDWQAILDPLTKLKKEADAQTATAFNTETGEDMSEAWKKLNTQITAIKGTIRKLLGKDSDPHVKEAEEALDQSFRAKLARDGAQSIADAFFRGGGSKHADVGPLVAGADYIKGELSKILNEALDKMGIPKAQDNKPKQSEYQRIAVALGLDDVRSDKLKEIDKLVRDRVNEIISNCDDSESWGEMVLSQWETASATMMNSPISGGTSRRVFKQVLKEEGVSIGDLLSMSGHDRTQAINHIATIITNRVQQAGSTKDLINLRKVMASTGHELVLSAAQQRAKIKARMEDSQKVAEDVIEAFENKFSGVPNLEKQDKKGIRKLVDDSIHAKEIMPDFVERAMAMGVDELTARVLGDMTLEHGRRKMMERNERERKAVMESIQNVIKANIKKAAGAVATSPKASKFIQNLMRAAELNLLDNRMFVDAFASAFNMNNLTPAVVKRLRDNWQEIIKVDHNGVPVHRGMPRETLERRFMESVNAVSPGAKLDNLIFDQYQAAALVTVSSMINQFSGIFRVLMGVDAFSRSWARGDVLGTAQEWWRNVSDLAHNLPLVLTGVKGESLGHLQEQLKTNFSPKEQKLALTGEGQTFRIQHKDGSVTTLGDTSSKILRLKELWTWRAIRGAEALSGITDAQARFRDVLTDHYIKGGMEPAAARAQAWKDIASTETENATAITQAQQEQADGLIGSGATVLRRRVQEITNERIESKLGQDLITRVEYLTAASQFKTIPTGVFGYPIYAMFNTFSQSKNAFARAGRFFFLFGRFLGHTVDTMMAYTPALSVATLARSDSESRRTQIIKEIYGDVGAYNKQQHGKHAAGVAFLLMNGMLMALAHALSDEDDDPFYQVFGMAPMASRDQKEAMMAAGKWKEGVVRIFGVDLAYSQIPELAPLFAALGNASDYARFGQQLYAKEGKTASVAEAGIMGMTDVLMSPVKRSTYKQWVTAIGSAMDGRPTDAFANIITQPIGTALRLPVVADLDKMFREMEGAQDAKGYGQNLLRRVPFVAVGDKMFNGYGEALPGLGVISMFPPDGDVSDAVKKAARTNVETGTIRSLPRDPELKDDRELTPAEREAFVKAAGRHYVESLGRNEAAVRRAFKQGGHDAAQKIISNISSKANKRAAQELGLTKD